MVGTIAAVSAATKVAGQMSQQRANGVIAGAQSQLKSKYGIGAYLRPRMWYLSLLKLSMSKPLITALVIIWAGIVLMVIFFGLISAFYGIYMYKALYAGFINVVLTLANTIYFAIHAVTEMTSTALLDVINAIADFFLVPIINMVNQIAVFIHLAEPNTNILPFTPIGGNEIIMPQPTHGFPYFVPTSAIYGSTISLFGFVGVSPGAEIYATDINGDVIYDTVIVQNGAELQFPRINQSAVVDGWWVPIADRPPDEPYIYVPTNTLGSYSTTIEGWIIEVVSDWLGGLGDNWLTRGIWDYFTFVPFSIWNFASGGG